MNDDQPFVPGYGCGIATGATISLVVYIIVLIMIWPRNKVIEPVPVIIPSPTALTTRTPISQGPIIKTVQQQQQQQPTATLWCTLFPDSLDQIKPLTVAIKGDLTSSSKQLNPPNTPDSGGLVGPDALYEYGFTPNGMFVKLSSHTPYFCLQQLSEWQKQNSEILN